VDNRHVTEVPLLDRAILNLAFLAPGVIEVGGGLFGNSSRAGHFAAAQAMARELVQSEPREFRRMDLPGLTSAQLGQQETTVKAFERAIVINPNDARPYLNLALVL